jgi:hypothetical protein
MHPSASKAEIADTISVAILMGVGPSMVYATEAMQLSANIKSKDYNPNLTLIIQTRVSKSINKLHYQCVNACLVLLISLKLHRRIEMKTVKSDTSHNRENLEGSIKEAVEADHHIRETVRHITLKALSEGKLDLHEITQVAGSVVKGAGLGAVMHGRNGQDKLVKAVAGLDDALCSAAEASKLAVEEASSHVKTFSKQELQRAINDLSELEGIYLDTLKDVAKEANETVSDTLNDLARHGRLTGTEVGQQATKIAKLLNQQLSERLSETVTAGVDSASKVTSNLAYAAAGILDGIAQTLDDKLTSNSTANKNK